MRGRRAERSAEGFETANCGGGGFVSEEAAAVVGRMDMMLGLRTDSSWKWERAATSSLENSLGSWTPLSMGAMKRGQRASQARRKAGRDRAAERTRASWTAAQNRGQRSVVSWRVALRMGVVGGERERIRMKSGLV